MKDEKWTLYKGLMIILVLAAIIGLWKNSLIDVVYSMLGIIIMLLWEIAYNK